jgi:hypothetical protein
MVKNVLTGADRTRLGERRKMESAAAQMALWPKMGL